MANINLCLTCHTCPSGGTSYPRLSGRPQELRGRGHRPLSQIDDSLGRAAGAAEARNGTARGWHVRRIQGRRDPLGVGVA